MASVLRPPKLSPAGDTTSCAAAGGRAIPLPSRDLLVASGFCLAEAGAADRVAKSYLAVADGGEDDLYWRLARSTDAEARLYHAFAGLFLDEAYAQ